MAFTKTPVDQTNETKSVELLYSWDNRGDANANTQDTLFKNALMEPIGSSYYQVMKRDGIDTMLLSPPIGAPILGMYYWETNLGALGPVFVFVTMDPSGTATVADVLIYDANTLVQLSALTIATTTMTPHSAIGFQEFYYESGAIDLCICASQGTSGVSGTYKITQTAYALSGPFTGSPSCNTCADLVYFDGYLCGTDGRNLINSALNDPTSWPNANFLAVDSYADGVLKVARVGAYVVCLGAESIQYFYDAAGVVGTPFAAVTGATKHIGYLGGWASTGDEAYFVGYTGGSPPTLYHMTGLKVEAVPSNVFTRMWMGENISQSGSINAAGIPIAPNGAMLRLSGHDCYYVRSASLTAPVTRPPYTADTGASYLYDIDSQQWTRIGYQATESLIIKQCSVATSSAATTTGATYGIPESFTYFCTPTDPTLKRFSSLTYNDDGVNFEVKFRTFPQNFGTNRMKFGQRLMVVGDLTPVSSLLSISWSDNDYKTTSTPRTVDMVNAYQPLFSLGSFRQRSFTLSYIDNYPMRWKNLELDYDQGNM